MGGTQNFVHKLLDIIMYIIKLKRFEHRLTHFNWSVTSIFCTEWWREISSSILRKFL